MKRQYIRFMKIGSLVILITALFYATTYLLSRKIIFANHYVFIAYPGLSRSIPITNEERFNYELTKKKMELSPKKIRGQKDEIVLYSSNSGGYQVYRSDVYESYKRRASLLWKFFYPIEKLEIWILGKDPENKSTEQNIRLQAALDRAEALLGALRKSQWQEAHKFVYLNENTRRRVGIPRESKKEIEVSRIAHWFQRLYSRNKPGAINSIYFSNKKYDTVLISYRHGDLDGFTMRLIDDVWYYTLD